jgi:hypothetical protein
VNIITKSLFKNRYNDLTVYLDDFSSFSSKIITHFYDIYITNTASLMYYKMFQFDTIYGPYNDAITEKNFSEMRKYVIDIIVIVLDIIKHFHLFEILEKLRNIIERVLCLFLKQAKAFFEDEYRDNESESPKMSSQVK